MSRALPRLGFGLPVSGAWATPETIARVARRAEELGYASLWTYQRVLTPVGSELGPGHEAVLDSTTALAYAAACTERIRIGTATVCAPFVAPVLLAKTMSSLDVLSGGRLTVGVGMGWMPEEYAAAGIPFRQRGARMDEYLRCLAALWTQEPVEFAGEFYTVPRSHQRPAPVQRPHPPILYGGMTRAAFRRAGRLAQGWIAGSTHDPDGLRAAVEGVRAGAREAGRDPDAVQILVRLAREPEPGELAALRARGVTDVLIDLNLAPSAPGDATAAERVLERCAPTRPRPAA